MINKKGRAYNEGLVQDGDREVHDEEVEVNSAYSSSLFAFLFLQYDDPQILYVSASVIDVPLIAAVVSFQH